VVDEGVEQRQRRRRVGHAHRADRAAVPGHPDRHGPGLGRADGFDDVAHAEPAGELADGRYPLLPPRGDDVGRPEAPTDVLTVGVPAHQDDPLRPEDVHRTQHRRQAYGTVADDRHRGSLPGAGEHCAVQAGRGDVAGAQQRRQQVLAARLEPARHDHQGAVGLRDPDRLSLPAVGAGCAEGPAVQAGGLQAVQARRAGVVRPLERRDHEVADPDAGHVGPDRLHQTEELMAQPGHGSARDDTPV